MKYVNELARRNAQRAGERVKSMALIGATSTALATAGSAFAEVPAIDTADVVTFIGTTLVGALVAVGGVWLIASAVSGGYSWIKGMASGK